MVVLIDITMNYVLCVEKNFIFFTQYNYAYILSLENFIFILIIIFNSKNRIFLRN